VSGSGEQYNTPPSPVMQRLADDGWDVIRINRNNLHERCSGIANPLQCWTNSGTKHVDDLLQRAHKARDNGYARVIAAGQSFGGAISLEANARAPGLFHAVIAFSPGHGSDVGDGSSPSGAYFSLDRQILDVLANQRSGRIVVSFPSGDSLHPNRYRDPIGPKARTVLAADAVPFVLFDQTSPIHGHGAARTTQFDAWYGPCLRDFVDPARTPPSGEVRCPPPHPGPSFLWPSTMARPTRGSSGPERWLGVWEGRYSSGREVAVAVEKIVGAEAVVVYAVGAGPNRDGSMITDRVANAKVSQDKLVIDPGEGRTLVLTMSADGRTAELELRSRERTLSGTLSRAD
jgi:pimeloyl-ACP methyl ester carboxylesterase